MSRCQERLAQAPLPHRGVQRSSSWQQSIQRQAQQQMQRCPGEAGAAPADVRFQEGGQRPAHRARESRDERDASDGAARVLAVEPNECCERGLVQTAAHADAKHDPGTEQTDRPLRESQCCQAECKHEAGAHQNRSATPTVDGAAGPRAEQRRHDERDRERREDRRHRDTEVSGHRRRQHRWQVVRRTPRPVSAPFPARLPCPCVRAPCQPQQGPLRWPRSSASVPRSRIRLRLVPSSPSNTWISRRRRHKVQPGAAARR